MIFADVTEKLIDRVKVSCPTRNKLGRFGDAVPSQSLASIVKIKSNHRVPMPPSKLWKLKLKVLESLGIYLWQLQVSSWSASCWN